MNTFSPLQSTRERERERERENTNGLCPRWSSWPMAIATTGLAFEYHSNASPVNLSLSLSLPLSLSLSLSVWTQLVLSCRHHWKSEKWHLGPKSLFFLSLILSVPFSLSFMVLSRPPFVQNTNSIQDRTKKVYRMEFE